MNIFYLHQDARTCAQMHNDRHVVKMVLETAQLLSTAHRIANPDLPDDACYKATHVNHPCAQWVRCSPMNYLWAHRLMLELDQERQYRFTPGAGKTIRDHARFLSQVPSLDFAVPHFTPVPQCMPTTCMHLNPIVAYRQYYWMSKQHLAKWTRRGEPYWWQDIKEALTV